MATPPSTFYTFAFDSSNNNGNLLSALGTLRPIALNKYNTPNAHRDEKLYQQFKKKLAHTVLINDGSSIAM